MSKSVVAIIVIILAVAGGVGYMVMKDEDKPESSNQTSSNETPSQTTENEATENERTENTAQAGTVTIEGFAFTPNEVTVKKGTAVKWTNQDTVAHSVVSDEGSKTFKESALLEKGESYSFTFAEAGTYNYHCGPHPNMKGTVIVTE